MKREMFIKCSRHWKYKRQWILTRNEKHISKKETLLWKWNLNRFSELVHMLKDILSFSRDCRNRTSNVCWSLVENCGGDTLLIERSEYIPWDHILSISCLRGRKGEWKCQGSKKNRGRNWNQTVIFGISKNILLKLKCMFPATQTTQSSLEYLWVISSCIAVPGGIWA